MDSEQIWRTYPRLFHMAAAGSWPSIKKHGLLSTSALLDLFEIDGASRASIEEMHRPESVSISHGVHGIATIRDQKPMREKALRKCLKGMSPNEWYQVLNRRVFFWPTESRLEGLLSALPYRGEEHCVLTVDTKSLVEAYLGSITLSPINSGSTLYKPQPRGTDTFKSIEQYPFEERLKARGRSNAIAEIAVDYSVPDIMAHVVRAERRNSGEALEVIWSR